jgi:ABC-type dipeptide/oligopeptide/nickel transport system permease subunit
MAVLVVVVVAGFVREEGRLKSVSEEEFVAVAGSTGENSWKRIRWGQYSWERHS